MNELAALHPVAQVAAIIGFSAAMCIFIWGLSR